jgi:hypothetical protein
MHQRASRFNHGGSPWQCFVTLLVLPSFRSCRASPASAAASNGTSSPSNRRKNQGSQGARLAPQCRESGTVIFASFDSQSSIVTSRMKLIPRLWGFSKSSSANRFSIAERTRGDFLKKQAILVLAILGVVAVSGARSTKLVFTWKIPALVLAMNGKASSRADFEDQMATGITRPGIQAIPSYSLMPRPEATPIDMDQLSGVVRAQSFDAALVSRLVKYDKAVSNVPGRANPRYPNYGTFYGYVGALFSGLSCEGYASTDRVNFLFGCDVGWRAHLDGHE